jgi:hypothetical protein
MVNSAAHQSIDDARSLVTFVSLEHSNYAYAVLQQSIDVHAGFIRNGNRTTIAAAETKSDSRS